MLSKPCEFSHIFRLDLHLSDSANADLELSKHLIIVTKTNKRNYYLDTPRTCSMLCLNTFALRIQMPTLCP